MDIYQIGLDFVAASSEEDFLQYALDIYDHSFIAFYGYRKFDKDNDTHIFGDHGKYMLLKDLFEKYALPEVTTPYLIYTWEGR